jgi:hypothetical protein
VRTVARVGALVALGGALVALTACGRAGAPVSPERVSPQPATDLSAVVVDRAVEIAWTMPNRRADNARLRDLAVMHVFRAEDDGAGDPKPALVSKGRVAGYAEVATVRMVDPAPALIGGGRVTLVDRAAMTPGRRYTYVVLAEDARGHVSPPSPRFSIALIASPVEPSDVRAVPGDREVRVEWRPPARLRDGASVDGPLVYEILRSAGPDAPPAVVAATASGATSYVDRNLDNERPYAYMVRALRAARGSVARGPASAAVTATPIDTTAPETPTDLVGIPSEGTVRLVWMPSPDPDVGRYIVYRGRDGAGLERVGSTATPGTTFVDRDVPAGRWRYAVSAQDGSSRANESARSVEVTVTVP